MSCARPSHKLFGVTHDPVTGEPKVVEPRTTKLSIGLPKGKALHVYIDAEGRWVIQSGFGRDISRDRLDSKEAAQRKYRELYKSAPERKYPERLPYFTFTKVAPTGDMEPDWDVISDHGPMPTEIDVVFLRDDPFAAAYQMWTAAEKKCFGDGKCALRVLPMAETDDEKRLADEARAQGEKYFPVAKCWLGGCKYSKQSGDRPSPCRPMGRLVFQLYRSPRLGGSVTFGTSGYRSINQLFSTIEIIKQATGGYISGIKLKMVLRPYRVLHNGKLATQYAVSLEYRASDAVSLKRNSRQDAVQYQMAGAEPIRQLEAGSTPTSSPEIPDLPAAAIDAEFVSDPGMDGMIPSDEALLDPLDEQDPADGAPLDEEPLPPDLDPALFTGPTGELAHAWPEEAPAEPSSTPAAPRATAHDLNRFRHLCHQRGVSDELVAEYLGRMGFETLEEVTAAAFPDMFRWADSWRGAGQRSLL